MATQLYIRIRRDLLLATRFLHVQQRLTKTPRQQKKQTKTKWLELQHAQHSLTHLIRSTTLWPRSNEMFVWFGGVAWTRHINASVPAATSCWCHPRVCAGMQEHASSHDSRGVDWRLKTDELQTKDWSIHKNKTSWVQHRSKPLMTTTTTTKPGVI